MTVALANRSPVSLAGEFARALKGKDELSVWLILRRQAITGDRLDAEYVKAFKQIRRSVPQHANFTRLRGLGITSGGDRLSLV